ncbi:MAG: CidA/LrgA family protein [Siculibacillus sp.]|nr:CidA/LrgA family protein [Siculibacillus sp.]
MVAGFAMLILCQLIGEVTVRGLGLPVPGPVLGLVILVLAAAAMRRGSGDDRFVDPAAPLGRVADGLLSILALLFVPAGVGVVQYLGLLGEHATAIGVALVASTVITLLATVATFLAIRRLVGVGVEDEEAGS